LTAFNLLIYFIIFFNLSILNFEYGILCLDDFSNIVQENPLIGGSVYFEVAKSAVNNLATATQDISNLTQAFFFALTR